MPGLPGPSPLKELNNEASEGVVSLGDPPVTQRAGARHLLTGDVQDGFVLQGSDSSTHSNERTID